MSVYKSMGLLAVLALCLTLVLGAIPASADGNDDDDGPRPSITGFSPDTGPVGTSVQIAGVNFSGTQWVSFGRSRASFTVDSNQQITATVPDGATTSRILIGNGEGWTGSSAEFTVASALPQAADLSLTVSESADPVTANSPLTYTISVHNDGPGDATDSIVTDTLPAEAIFSSASDGGQYDGSSGAVIWDLGTILAGSDASATLEVKPIHPKFPMLNSTSLTSSATDPTGPNAVVTDTTVNPEPGVHYISISDGEAKPFFRGPALGETVQWDFFGPSMHQITESDGVGLFDTGLQAPMSFYRFTFDQSGETRTQDLGLFPLNMGKISVPVLVSPSTGTEATSFQVTWALSPPASGIVQDVQVKRPGDEWHRWLHRQTTMLGDTFVPDAGPGTYYFRSRLRNVDLGTHSRLGPAVPITVTP